MHAEVLVTAGKTDAAALLDQADDSPSEPVSATGDAHRLLVRARYEYANGRPASVFGATLGRARDVAITQEAKALVGRIDALAAEWGVSSSV